MKNNNNFNQTISQLYSNGFINEYSDIEKELLMIIQPSIDKMKEQVEDSMKIEVEDLVREAVFNYAEKYFEVGFCKAMNIMLDTLVGGVHS